MKIQINQAIMSTRDAELYVVKKWNEYGAICKYLSGISHTNGHIQLISK